MSGIRIIQSFSAEKETNQTFRNLAREHRNTFMDAVRLNDAFGSVIDFSWGLGLVALYYAGVVVLGVEHVSIGTLVAFSTYI